MIKGQHSFWVLIAILGIAANIIVPLFLEINLVYTYLVPILMIWFINVFSQMGSREYKHDMLQIISAIPGGRCRQIVYSWAAGLLIALTLILPLAIHQFFSGQFAEVFAALAGATFLPSLALFLGVFTKTSRIFEIFLIIVTFMIVNGVPTVMYIGYPDISSFYHGALYLLLSVLLGITAILRRQVRV